MTKEEEIEELKALKDDIVIIWQRVNRLLNSGVLPVKLGEEIREVLNDSLGQTQKLLAEGYEKRRLIL